jgi:hypothetical protein
VHVRKTFSKTFHNNKNNEKRLKSLRIPQGIQKPELKDEHTIKWPNEKHNRRNNDLKKKHYTESY